MHDRQALDDSLRQLMHHTDTPGALTADALAERLSDALAAARSVLGVDGTGLMMLDERGELCVVGSSDPPSALLELAQQRTGVGPGVDCVRRDRTVTVDDLGAGGAYPRLWEFMVEADGDVLPFRGVASAPILISGRAIGTLNVMTAAAHRWTRERIEAVEAYANVLAVLLRLGAAAQPGTIAGRLLPDED
ncbi:GAF domain-containing protein [Catenuloplanes atrovinosus]|uniref:GAF domain-containing protein n=1 Tax=Catenuloplanes atrovinosus TaxID=137266 RepID=A0AAE4CCT6_9ACTN|nr:GAF domain-containing protein [Catenuloplanes atrovinosus]MDR7276855.1 GAF domain-containing protein [Catenuloplanes atrovinosus]